MRLSTPVARLKGACALAALAAVTACASPPAAPLATALKSAPVATKPTPFRIAVAPLQLSPSAFRSPEDASEPWAAVHIDRARLQSSLLQSVRDAHAFGDLVFLSELNAKLIAEELAAIQANRIPRALADTELLDAAYAEGADYLLTLTVERHAVRYAGHNSWYIPNMLNYLATVFPAWWVADEQYAAEFTVHAKLVAVGTMTVAWEKTYKSEQVRNLDHFDRGWMLFGTFTVPGSLELKNYESAAEHVFPHAVNDVATQLKKDTAALSESVLASTAKRPPATYALCIGAGRSKSLIDLRVASDDAKAFYQLLIDPQGCNIPARNVTLLVENEPTKKRLTDALAQLAKRAHPGDRVYVYYAGYGFIGFDDAYLVPYDIEPLRPVATALSLREIGKDLDDKGVAQVLVLDTAFWGPSGSRGQQRALDRELLQGNIPSFIPTLATQLAQSYVERLATGRTVVLATAAGSPASALSPIRQDKLGLFTARWVSARASRAADRDADGWLSLEETFAAASQETSQLSARFGTLQQPVVLGDVQATAALPFVKVSTK